MSVSQRLAELGIELPAVAAPVAAYVPAVVHDGLVYTSGQLPFTAGELPATGKVGAEVSAEDANGYARTCEALAEAGAAAVERIEAPVLLVTGDEDGVAPPQSVRAFAEKLHSAKSTRVVVLPRCGHWTPIERPEECARELRDFLAAQR